MLLYFTISGSGWVTKKSYPKWPRSTVEQLAQSLALNPATDSTKNKKIAKDYIQVKTKPFWKLQFWHLGARFKSWTEYILILKALAYFTISDNGRVTEKSYPRWPRSTVEQLAQSLASNQAADSTKNKKIAKD